MTLVDTHAHLYWDSFQPDLDRVIQNALNAHVNTIINVGTSLETSKIAANQNLDPLMVYSSIGIHPHEAVKYLTSESIHQHITGLTEVYRQNNKNKIIAVGECGLDFFFRENPGYQSSTLALDQQKDLQKKLFKAQIELAKNLNLPLIIHCRDSALADPSAWQEIFLPQLEGTKGVFHNFTGSGKEAKKALSLGYYLSFSCILTYPKNDHLRELIKKFPLEKILTETDCPFLPPQIRRGQRNEPAHSSLVVEVIAQMKNLAIPKVATAISTNLKTLFGV